ncbi:hypothetical protein UY3_08409 [Chelonia mydas]|uniref:Uncharacterized protein n=1 Tax=Chelonia mydas TaxID=8469 RepID=M7BQS8_CHEMY|nr:hypothetical protein UY3_08409 [Chelonia mydas]
MCWPLLPAARIGLEQRTAPSGSCDWPNLWKQQYYEFDGLSPLSSVQTSTSQNTAVALEITGIQQRSRKTDQMVKRYGHLLICNGAISLCESFSFTDRS